ncbi:MAG TPA: transglutaminase-like domain-containing protein [Chitinophagaceae bacterium]|jgi:transglutaminase-like putative cysteine protease
MDMDGTFFLPQWYPQPAPNMSVESSRMRDQLPDEAKKKIHALTDSLHNEREKINAVYRFLQQNTHYVSIQLGIGGWQPFDAAYVYNKRYGDCKALSNYMVAMLREIGISGNSVLIRGGAGMAGVDTMATAAISCIRRSTA